MRSTTLQLGKNEISAGDVIRVKPSAPGRRDGLEAIFKSVELDDETGEPRWVDVWDDRRGQYRSFYLNRIEAKRRKRVRDDVA